MQETAAYTPGIILKILPDGLGRKRIGIGNGKAVGLGKGILETKYKGKNAGNLFHSIQMLQNAA